MSSSAQSHAPQGPDAEARSRQRWMSLLACASHAELQARVPEIDPGADTLFLRRPETGLVMVRARTGGTGAQFNLGEMAVTRCALRLADGTVGMSYVRGRDAHHAQRAALVDAWMQQADRAGDLSAAWSRWIAPLEQARNARHAQEAAQAQSTRVDFFTLMSAAGAA